MSINPFSSSAPCFDQANEAMDQLLMALSEVSHQNVRSSQMNIPFSTRPFPMDIPSAPMGPLFMDLGDFAEDMRRGDQGSPRRDLSHRVIRLSDNETESVVSGDGGDSKGRSCCDIVLIIIRIFAAVILFPATIALLVVAGPQRVANWIMWGQCKLDDEIVFDDQNPANRADPKIPNRADIQPILPRNVSFEDFNLRKADVALNELKMIPFDEMFTSFSEPHIADLGAFWRAWDDADFGTSGLKASLQNRFQNLNDGDASGKVREYIVILLNIFGRYRLIVETDEGNSEEAVETYRQNFVAMMQRVLDTFNDGCSFNQLSYLKTILSEAIELHPNLATGAAAGISKIDFLFALAVNKYQIELVRKIIAEEAAITGNERLINEGVELEFVVMKQLAMIVADFNAHFFEGSREAETIADKCSRAYKPLDYFVSELTRKIPGDALRKFHTDILRWYQDRGMSPDDSMENVGLLLNRDSVHNAEEGVYDYWFNEKAILYYFAENGLLQHRQHRRR